MGRVRVQLEQGRIISRLLVGSWRESPSTPDLSEAELDSITQRLCESGAAALAWWRIRDSQLAHTQSGERLHNAYRQFRLSAAKHEREIKRVLLPLQAAGMEPVLVKGWAIARLYPDRGLRPYGDIDLCVAPEEFAEAARVLKLLESGEGHHVDLHAGFDRIGCGAREQTVRRFRRFDRSENKQDKYLGRVSKLRGATESQNVLRNPHNLRTDSWHEVYIRSQLVDLDEIKVRVLCAEDHLRVLALHFLRSGALRPHGLCDIALILERIKEHFDWKICLGSDPLHANWVLCTVGLAQELLDAGLGDLTSGLRPLTSVPSWLAPAVIRQWGRPREHYAAQITPRPSSSMNLINRCAGLYARWENPVRATARVKGRFDDRPRLPYLLLESILRLPELVN